MSDWNKFFRKFRKEVRDPLFADILGSIPRLGLPELLQLLPQVQEAIRKASPETWTSSTGGSYAESRGIDRHITHEGAESAEELH